MEPRMLDKINDLIRIRSEVVQKTADGQTLAEEIMEECKLILDKVGISVSTFALYHGGNNA